MSSSGLCVVMKLYKILIFLGIFIPIFSFTTSLYNDTYSYRPSGIIGFQNCNPEPSLFHVDVGVKSIHHYGNNNDELSLCAYMFTDPKRCATWTEDQYAYAAFTLLGVQSGGYTIINDDAARLLMQQWQLYNYPPFWQFIRRFPIFERYILFLYNTIQQNPQIKNQLNKKAQSDFATYYAFVQKCAKEQCQNEERIRVQQEQARIVQAHMQALTTCQNLLQAQQRDGIGDAELIQNRLNAAHLGIGIKNESYALTPLARQLLNDHGYSSDPYSSCTGNQLQQILHAEQVEILHQTAGLEDRTFSAVPLILRCVKQGVTSNKQGNIFDALVCTDMAHGLVQLAKSTAKGIAKGVTATCAMVIHPLEAVKSILHPLVQVADYTIRCFAAHSASARGNNAPLQQLIQDNYTCLRAIWHQCKEQTWHEYIEQGVACAVEGFLTGQLTHAASTKFLQATAEIKTLIKAEVAAETVHLATTEGELIKVTVFSKEEASAKKVLQESTTPSTKGRFVTKYLDNPEIIEVLVKNNKKPLIIPPIAHTGVTVAMFNEKPITHIFQLTLIEEVSASEKIYLRAIGLHHDHDFRMFKAGRYEMTNVVVHPNGVVEGFIIWKGQRFRKTFFPPEWTEQKVIDVVTQAMQNPCQADFALDNKRISRRGKAAGIEIEIIFSEDGKSVITGYPIVNTKNKEIICIKAP